MAVLTGCGSTGAPSGTATSPSSRPNVALQYAQCMRANGVPNFPDPPIKPGRGIDFQSPAFQSASKTCEKYLPRSTGAPPAIPAAVRREWLAFAKCVRANGVPSFPDPGPNGIQFPLGSPIPQSPAFQHAQNACKKYIAGG